MNANNMEGWVDWWFVNGGAAHRLWKARKYREIFDLATSLPQKAWYAAQQVKQKRIDTLYDAIAHGDDQHRAWLKKKIEEHFA